jgi:uncharacterized membrane protein YdcZ (DUF606 family)
MNFDLKIWKIVSNVTGYSLVLYAILMRFVIEDEYKIKNIILLTILGGLLLVIFLFSEYMKWKIRK